MQQIRTKRVLNEYPDDHNYDQMATAPRRNFGCSQVVHEVMEDLDGAGFPTMQN
jgi:hypothetical protein